MYEIFGDERFGLVVGVNWLRWFVGVSLELDQPDNARCGTIRFGPFFMHIIVHD